MQRDRSRALRALAAAVAVAGVALLSTSGRAQTPSPTPTGGSPSPTASVVASTPPPRATPTPTPRPPEGPRHRHFVAWSTEGLPARTERALDRADGISATTMLIGLEWLSTARRNGETRYRAPQGYAYPLEAAYVEPREYRRFVNVGSRPAIGRIAQGTAILGTTSADLRGDRTGDRLVLGARRVRVEAVLGYPDTQGYEVLRTRRAAPAAALRLVLIRAHVDVEPRRVRRMVRRIVSDRPVETVSRRQSTLLRYSPGTVQPYARIKARFGEFAARPSGGVGLDVAPEWIGRNITTSRVPLLGRVTCHGEFIPMLRGALAEVRDEGLSHLVDREDYAGCFNARFVATAVGARISRHAWGIAVDLNARANPFGARPRQDRRLVRIMERWGFVWGGRWLVPDGMHFEWFGAPRR